ncbi:MAG: F0F1 ATP synthase subunit A [Pseudomonadota bacterium]
MHDPLHQFVIQPIVALSLAGIDISFTNSALFMVLGTALVIGMLHFGLAKKTLVPSRRQSLVEVSYEFIAQMVQENAGREGLVYFPFVFSLFMFVLMGNLLGMVPYSFTFTSHIIVTFALALMVFILVTIIGFVKHGWRFLRLFCPEGIPLAVTPILVPIEILAYFTRPVTLAVRLFANMLAGHVILKIFGGFTFALGLWGIGPLALNVVFTGFEFFVAGIQAFIFTVLTCLYLHDALHLH